MKYIKHLFVSLLLIFILLVLGFSLSSKDDIPPATDCESFNHAEDEIVTIQVLFSFEGGYNNIPYRNEPTFSGYYPEKDLRSNYETPEQSLASFNDSYYCVVEIYTPDCYDWVWTSRMDVGGTGFMDVHLPKADYFWDVVIDIKYYERCSPSIPDYDAFGPNGSVVYELWSNTSTGDLYNGTQAYFYVSPQYHLDCYTLYEQDEGINAILNEEWFQQ